MWAEPLRAQLIELMPFSRTTDALKEDREAIDYYAVDLVEMAAYLTNPGCCLQDAAAASGSWMLANGTWCRFMPVSIYPSYPQPQRNHIAGRVITAPGEGASFVCRV
jgi:hypothetical protein